MQKNHFGPIGSDGPEREGSASGLTWELDKGDATAVQVCDPRRQINQRHGYGAESLCMTRRRWDYFVRYLLGAAPRTSYELHPPAPGPGI